MKIVVANCSVIYTGRGDTKLSDGVRVIVVKSDGAVSVHHDAGNKPLNYMGKGNVFTVEETNDGLFWNFDTRKESLQIHLKDIFFETNMKLDVDNSVLERDGTENQLQAWIAANPESLGAGYTLVQREFPTGAGPVDLLVQDELGTPVAVEVKRVAMLGAADQANRYVESLKTVDGFHDVRGMIAALDIRPNTVKLAEKRGISMVTLPSNWNSKTDFLLPDSLGDIDLVDSSAETEPDE